MTSVLERMVDEIKADEMFFGTDRLGDLEDEANRGS
jgi:2-hydroxychromene-2-carboxylate isomerase